MPRGTRRTSYVRDTRGRFASTPGGGAPNRPPAKKASRGTNRLTRDNSGRITSVGGNGATARGGRLRTGAGNLRARQTDRLKRAPLQGAVSRGGKARATAARKPVGWMQSPEARKDRVQQAADRKSGAKKLRALPKDARRAIQVERLARRQKGIIVAGNTARQLTNIAEGRIWLIGNVGKRKDKLTPGQISAMARTMSESARRLKVGMATARRGRMKYNPNALQIGTGTAARKIRGARVGVVARKTGAAKAAPPKPAAPKRVKAGRVAGTVAKPRGMKPGALAAKRQKPAGKVDMKQAISRAKELRQQAKKLQAQGEAMMSGGRRDRAITNVPLNSRARRAETNRGIKGAQLVARAATLNNRAERVLERAVASRKKAEREAAKPARAPRSAESLRLSRAKHVEKRRSINISNPAGWRDDSAGRMAANAARTQQRALAFYGGKPKKKAVASNATAAKSIKPGAGKAPRRISYLLAYHGTNKESAAAIRAGGYKQTRYGTYGDGVYATTSRKAAREYASWRAAGGKNKFGEAFPASALGPAVLTHRIPKTRVNRNDTRAAFNNMAAREWVQSGRARKLSREWTNHVPYVVMNEQLANRTLVNRSGTIRRPRKPRRKP